MLKRSAPIGLTKYRVPSNTVRFKEPRLGPMSKKTTSYRPASEVQRAEHQLLFLRPPMLPPAASLHAWLKVSSTMESLGWPGRRSTPNRFLEDNIGDILASILDSTT